MFAVFAECVVFAVFAEFAEFVVFAEFAEFAEFAVFAEFVVFAVFAVLRSLLRLGNFNSCDSTNQIYFRKIVMCKAVSQSDSF